jgi:hypothetical protein
MRRTGRVEMDECYVAGAEEDLPGGFNLDKMPEVVAAQEDEPGIGQIPDASVANLVPFVQDSVAEGYRWLAGIFANLSPSARSLATR